MNRAHASSTQTSQIPHLSIIIPAFNAEKFLSRCLQSVAAQTFPNFEVVLIDDGSKDNTLALAENWARHESRIRLFSQENRGLAATRNRGIHEARTSLIMFVDSDDYLEPNAVELLIRLKEEKKAQIALGWYVNEDLTGKRFPLHEQALDGVISGKKAYLEALYDLRIQNYSCMKIFDKALFEGIQFPEGDLLEDYQTIYKVFLRAKRFAITSQIVYHYVVHEASILNNKDTWLKLHCKWLEIFVQRYKHAMNTTALSRREKQLYRIYCIRKLIRLASTLSWQDWFFDNERKPEDVEVAVQKTQETIGRIYGREVRPEDYERVVKQTVKKKILVRLFYW
ncbi:MAG: glycosyltransferase family 2 protein [Bacteroides sp.]